MEFIEIGKIINTFGIRGELKIDCFTDFIEQRFAKDSLVYIGEDKIPFIVKKHNIHKGFLIVQFKDYEDINLVEKYKNQIIYKNKEDIHKLKEGEYYFSELKDLDVYVNNEIVGKVVKVESGISSNYLRVKTSNKESLVPFLPVFIEKVELENHKIHIKKIEGLL